MIYKYLWQKNKNKSDGKPDAVVIKGLFKEVNEYLRESLRKIKNTLTSRG